MNIKDLEKMGVDSAGSVMEEDGLLLTDLTCEYHEKKEMFVFKIYFDLRDNGYLVVDGDNKIDAPGPMRLDMELSSIELSDRFFARHLYGFMAAQIQLNINDLVFQNVPGDPLFSNITHVLPRKAALKILNAGARQHQLHESSPLLLTLLSN